MRSIDSTDFSRSVRLRSATLLLLAEDFARELQEDLAVAAQRIAGDGIEARTQPLERHVERERALADGLVGRVDLGPGGGELDLERMYASPAEQPAGEERDGRQQHQQQHDGARRRLQLSASGSAVGGAARRSWMR